MVVTEPTIRSQCHPSGRRPNSDYFVHAAGGGRASSPRARARRASRDSIPCAVLPPLPCVGRRSGGAYLLAYKSGATAARLIEKHRRTRPSHNASLPSWDGLEYRPGVPLRSTRVSMRQSLREGRSVR